MIVTDPPNTWTTEASIGIVARPCRRTTAVCPSAAPVPLASPQDETPLGLWLRGKVTGRRLLDRRVGQPHGLVQTLPVGTGLVQGVGGIERGAVGGVQQPGARELDGGGVHPADDQHQGDRGEAEDQEADLPPFAVGPSTPGRPRPGDAPACAPRRHGCRNRSTVATWEAETGIDVGSTPANTGHQRQRNGDAGGDLDPAVGSQAGVPSQAR